MLRTTDYGLRTMDYGLESPVCDLVLLSWNHLEQTRPCLESLFETTDLPCRLLIVDNGSEPEVRVFLSRVQPRGRILEVVLLQNERNEGFPRGMNRGIEASRAPYVCLLNNDLLFTRGWLGELIAVVQANPRIGVVNPESNTFGNRPPKGQTIDAYAQALRSQHGRYTEVGMCIGFCMLITRELIGRIGGLTEEVERIFFEDEDYCMRAQEAGWLCVVAAASYVEHAEHQTVRKMPEREALFARNQRWCEGRWGRRIRVAWPHLQPVVPASPELRQWLERLITLARRRIHVYVYAPLPDGLKARDLFSSVGLVPHADIHWYRVPSPLAGVAAAGLILQRRKKPFDIIISPEKSWGARVSRLRWLHGAAVVAAADEVALTEAWRQKSRSLS
ncbi:MAG: glycosyltransferase family 2 protein [Candidatus Omnitrophica bacterium]|nr:glycosyltransferase family 2 protein [Candidatus Omnitrophota bacterium]